MFYPRVKYEYDTRIDEYNWVLIIFIQFIFYFVLQVLVRIFVPEPGDIKTFRERKKLKDYHFYYFQFTSILHATIGCIVGKLQLRYDCCRSFDIVLWRLQIQPADSPVPQHADQSFLSVLLIRHGD
jgi:hypothetical protein